MPRAPIFTCPINSGKINRIGPQERAAFFALVEFFGLEIVRCLTLVPVTRTGYEKLKAELDTLENVEMPKIAQRIATVRSEGDLSENAEYHGARESQGMLQAKINVLAR